MSPQDKILRIIEHVRPYMLADGGDLEFVKFVDGIVTVKFSGACAGCGLVSVDLEDGIKQWLMSEVPEVKDVVIDESEPFDYSAIGYDGYSSYDL